MLSKFSLWVMPVISSYLDVAEWALWYESFERFDMAVLDVSDNLFSWHPMHGPHRASTTSEFLTLSFGILRRCIEKDDEDLKDTAGVRYSDPDRFLLRP